MIITISLCVFNSNFYNLMHKNHNIHYKLITLHMIVYQSKPVWWSLTQLLFCHKSLRCVAEFHHVLILKLVWTIAFILHHWFFVQLFIFQIMAWSFLGLTLESFVTHGRLPVIMYPTYSNLRHAQEQYSNANEALCGRT